MDCLLPIPPVYSTSSHRVGAGLRLSGLSLGFQTVRDLVDSYLKVVHKTHMDLTVKCIVHLILNTVS